ncbi:hypothetical protein ACFQS2_00645 [Brachybacterium sp. GCM10030267]|uniref:hypothetical protein n=1 Tax=unclassified Brachybacterium TaxID=2623841 RepID=UPI00360B225E
MTQTGDFTPDPTQDPATAPDPDPAVDPEQDPALGPTQDPALEPEADPAEDDAPVDPAQDAAEDAALDPAQETAENIAVDPDEDLELEETVETSQDEYARAGDEAPGEPSIDDALETDRVAAEGGDSRNTDGFRYDATQDRGLEEYAAAEQGNREGDEMVTDGDGPDETSQLAGSDADTVAADPDTTEFNQEFTDPGA